MISHFEILPSKDYNFSSKSLLQYFMIGLFTLGTWSCGEGNRGTEASLADRDRQKLHELANSDLDLTGIQLSQAYCGTCHLKPDPELLDKKTWEKSVLPDMRKRLGLRLPEDPQVAINAMNPEVYPVTAYISESDWKKIEAYYLEEAPEKPLPQQEIPEIEKGIPGFKLEIPDLGKQRAPLTTMLRKDMDRNLLYVGDRLGQVFVLQSDSMEIIDSIQVDSAPSDIRFRKDGSLDLLTMGIMDPSTKAIGQWNRYPGTGLQAPNLQFENLNRPVHFAFGDLNQNGMEDVVISNFGNHKGNLAWFEQTQEGYKEHRLRDFPGARRAFIEDMDGDGLPDIVVLMAQAYEGVYIFYNQGGGKFLEKAALQFHPLFGCSDFDLVDFDGDGHLDILLTNGDNADLSPIFKNYHGVRIFLNDGKNNFEEAWFFPMHGASRAIAGDFNGNGEMDVAAISFFPDWDQMPRQDFLYFQNQGNLNFKPFALPEPLISNWLILEKADLDNNGKEDLLLGSLMFQPAQSEGNFFAPWVPFVVLRNHN
ncbi:FG-GAP repeat domain-containing protein [Pararhodonellum marinum]|uniref:FG-GAP repeat domain-containing protein n=1 Tax=Pararhodonellum marinum TaxID=2755358 RepID=UPI00188ECFA9|nr:VCBS repeat-containing protein [Pararhodonellum marinum]